jgi:hypothetical protein
MRRRNRGVPGECLGYLLQYLPNQVRPVPFPTGGLPCGGNGESMSREGKWVLARLHGDSSWDAK